MGYSVEDNGSRRYKINSNREIVSPSTGQDYYVDRVKSRLGLLAMVRGRIFHPVDMPDDPLKVHFDNGWSAPAASYYGTASKMAARGIAIATFDSYHFPRRIDMKDPLYGAESGGMAMIDIMDDVVGDGETARIGHSTGALVSWRLALKHDNTQYVIGHAPVGIQHRNMDKVYMDHMKEMIKDEFYIYIKSLPKDRFGASVAAEFLALNTSDPSRLVRQVKMLFKGPDLAPMLAKAHEKDILNGLIFLEDDRFFHLQDQLNVLDRKQHLIDDMHIIDDARHLHPNLYPTRDAEVRIAALNSLRSIRRLREQLPQASGE